MRTQMTPQKRTVRSLQFPIIMSSLKAWQRCGLAEFLGLFDTLILRSQL